MKKMFRVVKNFKIVKRSCSLNRYYRVCNWQFEIGRGQTTFSIIELQKNLATSDTNKQIGQFAFGVLSTTDAMNTTLGVQF